MGLTRRTLLRTAGGPPSPFHPRRRDSDGSAPAPPSKPRRNPFGRIRLAAVRMAAVTLLMLGVAVLAGNVFDRLEWTLFVSVGAGAAAAVAAGRLPARVPVGGRIGLVVAVLAAAVCAVALLAGGRLGDAVPGIVDGPRRLVTTEWPSPSDPTVVATLALLLGTATALAVDLARRPNLHLAPLGPVLVALVVVVALSAPRPPSWSLLAALAGGALLLALARHGDKPGSRLATLRGEGAVAMTLLAIGAAALGTAAVVAWAGRADPRQVAVADRSASLLRPLEATVALRDATPPREQFRITDESPLIGQRMPTRWRTAALDVYDGQRWLPLAEVRPIGDRLGPDVAAGAGAPATGHYRIELLTGHTELVPLPGPPIELASEPEIGVETDVERVVVRLSEPASAGTVLRLVAELAPTVGEVAPAAIVARPVGEITGAFTDLANELAGEGDALTRLQQLEQELRGWQLDPDAPGGGQQLRLLTDFVTKHRRGTAEQFTAAFVLLARSLGFDARLATGFALPPDAATSPVTVTSRHAAAWPEVNVANAGWLAFDPVPEAETGDDTQQDPPPEAQTPAAAQPPIDPPARQSDNEREQEDDTDPTEERWGSLTSWVTRGALAVVAVAVPAAIALATILAIKYLRRRRRLTAAHPSERVRGAWANTTDALVDAGLTIEPSWTDDRIAAMGAPLVGSAPHQLRRLATMSTAATFGPLASPDEVSDAIATERMLRGAIAERLTGWQRLRWYVNLRSLRPATRSPLSS